MPWLRDFRTALRVLRAGADHRVAWRVAAISSMVLAGGLLSGAAPLALKEMIDAVGQVGATNPSSSFPAWGCALAYLGALCAARLLADVRPTLVGTTEQHLYARLKQRYFRHLLDLPLHYHLGRQTGAVVQSLEQAISGYQILVYHLVNSVFPVVIELATVAVVLASLDQPELVASFIMTGIAYLSVVVYSSFRVRDGSDAITSGNLDTHGMLTDSLINCETIKCFNAAPAIGDRFAQRTDRLESHWCHWWKTRATLGLTLTATFALAMAALLGIAIHATTQGTLSVGGFVLANVYMLQVVRPLEMLGGAARDLSQSLAFIRPLLSLLEERTEATAATNVQDVQEEQRPPAISFRNIRFSYEEQEPVLQSFDLDIAPGRHVAIVGASGSGKSSLVRLLFRLYAPQSGCIRLDGHPIDSLPLGDLRSRIGLVPQDTVLFNDSIGFNIGIGQVGAGQQHIEEAARLAGLHDFVRRLPDGYDTVVGERGLKLSGGERQRIAIARVVLKRPRIYVFDEATSSLDTLTEQAILRNLRAVSAGCTTITVAHRLSTARHADEIVVLAQGRVAERGDHASLLARSGLYARMWEAQAHGAFEHASP
jgi:ATP-binding cassette subfamily B protein